MKSHQLLYFFGRKHIFPKHLTIHFAGNIFARVFQHYIMLYCIANNFLETLVNAFSTFTNASGLQISYKLFHHFFGDEFRFNATLIHGVFLFQEVFETAKCNLHHANVFLCITVYVCLIIIQEINRPVFL